MALVIENGSGVPGAESFATADELVTYAVNFGKVIPAEPIQLEALLRRAALQMNALPWKGGAARRDQPLSWPRAGVKRNGWELPHNQIPPQIKAGQMALAAEIHADDLTPPELKKGAVTMDRVDGAVTRQYAEACAKARKAAAGRQSSAQFADLLESSSQVTLRRS